MVISSTIRRNSESSPGVSRVPDVLDGLSATLLTMPMYSLLSSCLYAVRRRPMPMKLRASLIAAQYSVYPLSSSSPAA